MTQTQKLRPAAVLGLFAVYFVIIFSYFYNWRSHFFYGDDLIAFRRHAEFTGDLWKQLNLSFTEEKLRPVQSFVIHFLIVFFGKNVSLYLFFNVAVQALNTLMLFFVLRLLTKSSLSSFVFSLVFCISRFAFFNISQLIYGGTQEGFSTGFFLVSLFYLLKALDEPEAELKLQFRRMAMSVLFANLSIYSHERYLVMLPFIAFVALLFPILRNLTTRQRLSIIGLVIASVTINFVVKNYVLHFTFFKGTGGQNMEFHGYQSKLFYIEALNALVEVNDASRILVCKNFDDLPQLLKTAVQVLHITLALTTVLYLAGVVKGIFRRNREVLRKFVVFSLLVFLGLLTIVPATLTIRLEQRWLQGSLAMLIVVAAIAANNTIFNRKLVGVVASFVIAILFLAPDCNYFTTGAENMYIRTSDRFVGKIYRAFDSGRIKPTSTRLLICQDKINIDDQSWINWVIDYGYIFDMVNSRHKSIGYIDTATPHQISSFNDTTQIIYVYEHSIDTIHYPDRVKKL